MATVERSRLNAARTLAHRRNDFEEVAQIDVQLAALGTPTKSRASDDSADLMTKVNERNRKANMEAVRKAEVAEAERKRRERKLTAAGAPVPVADPSARLKTVPRMFNSATPTTSRFVNSFTIHGLTDVETMPFSLDRERRLGRLSPRSQLKHLCYHRLHYQARRMVALRRLRHRLLMLLMLI